ncbi:MAG: AAA family ATPase, partial [Prevotella sp.]|nr:AAA family ATPase [Prevotella sp.]
LYTPDSLSNFIGQEHIKKPLLKEIAIAKNEGRKHLDNILLFGNPGLGKTTLMELIAKELGVKFELLDCSQFRNSQQSLKALQNFFMRIARDNEPVVIALDEIHMLNEELQSSLLTLLNNRVYVSPLDVNGQCKRIPIDEFTFIAATTDDDKVLDTIKNRCLRLKFQMVDYTHDELKLIYKNKVAAKGLTITEGAVDACIPRSRGAIRYVNAIVEGLNSALYNDEGERVSTHIDVVVALKYFEEKGIDSMGLERKDLEILRVIEGESSGVISADVLSARVGLETKKYINEYERYLIKIGFINVTGRGRSLTEKAIRYLNPNTDGGKNALDDDAQNKQEGTPIDIIDDIFGGGNV